jgi:hypothetical protein
MNILGGFEQIVLRMLKDPDYAAGSGRMCETIAAKWCTMARSVKIDTLGYRDDGFEHSS